MKLFAYASALILVLILGHTRSTEAQQPQHQTPLNNQAVVKLAKAGFKDKTIISIISARLPNFDLSPERMIELKRNGVSENVIMAMLARQDGADVPDDSWGDDAFFANDPSFKIDKNDPTGASVGAGPGQPDASTNIFGSSAGSKGRIKQKGLNGSNENDTQTVGSATVRILRPPAEPGGDGSTKLEKTKSLTNDSIVELVEAGFSEGTIIRRIEQSPVDFDLAQPKMDDLKKRRVSEKILTAMKTAMGNESSK